MKKLLALFFICMENWRKWKKKLVIIVYDVEHIYMKKNLLVVCIGMLLAICVNADKVVDDDELSAIIDISKDDKFAKLQERANNADGAAFNELGVYFSEGGDGKFSPNIDLAIRYWLEGSRLNDAEAMGHLAKALYAGDTGKRDVNAAATLWLKSAKLGNAESQYFIGMAYSQGIGVMRDIPTAIFWWEKASQQGNQRAQNNLAFAYARGQVVKKDSSKAFELWKASGEQGNIVAQTNMALCYYTGDGVKKDQSRAVAIWTNAAERGNIDAQKYLGLCYAMGSGVKKDKVKALRWYDIAASRGDVAAKSAADELRLAIAVKGNQQKANSLK